MAINGAIASPFTVSIIQLYSDLRLSDSSMYFSITSELSEEEGCHLMVLLKTLTNPSVQFQANNTAVGEQTLSACR